MSHTIWDTFFNILIETISKFLIRDTIRNTIFDILVKPISKS
ncbi:putative F-box and FNIP repeat-containing protein [Megavirus courdo7]|uniref:Putative F-box and FNIP repeat-containing protein n=1 Tax=Megavirus courdo7 TaxID=1128135 RepID=H2EA99_9VIRU|nr:putative F-box and FNIP repeat-containing protein [Megavirus courdo7]